jgi:hypothetical protein
MKNWTRKDYDNAVGAIVKWFWEPLSDYSKRELKEHMRRMDVGYETDKFISAVFGVRMCAILAPNELGLSESDSKNIDEILSFIEKYQEQLDRFDPEDDTVIVGEDWDIESDYERLIGKINKLCDLVGNDTYDDVIDLLQDYLPDELTIEKQQQKNSYEFYDDDDDDIDDDEIEELYQRLLNLDSNTVTRKIQKKTTIVIDED